VLEHVLYARANVVWSMDQQFGVDLRWYVLPTSEILELSATVFVAIHMAFDCMAIGVGLFASVMATWEPNERFTYGYACPSTFSFAGVDRYL
jgi:hypothetical protein